MIFYLIVLLIAWVLSFSPYGGENNKKVYTEELFKIRVKNDTLLKSDSVKTVFVYKKAVIVQKYQIRKIIKTKKVLVFKKNKGPPTIELFALLIAQQQGFLFAKKMIR